MEKKLGRRESLFVIFWVGVLAIAALLWVLLTRDEPRSPAMAELDREMKAAQRTGNMDGVLTIAMDPARDPLIREKAARDLSVFCVGAPSRCDTPEAAFVRARDSAAAPEDHRMRTLLSALNQEEIRTHEAALVTRVEQIMEGGSRSLASGPPPGGAATVDAIFDFIAADTGPSAWRRAEPYQLGYAISRLSPFDGLARAEMPARAAELNQIGVVRHWRVPLGQYSGDCVGTAYRAMASVYLVSLSQHSIIDTREISGGDPPSTSVTLNQGVGGRAPNCDADGGKPSVDGILIMRAR